MSDVAGIEPLLLLAGGLLGSAHCLGMCGGFVLMLGSGSAGRWSALSRQIVYAMGRISVYSFGGAAAGFAGWRLNLEARSLIDVQGVLCVLAGGLLALEGCWSLGWLPRLKAPAGCPMISFGSLLRAPGWRAAFAAGVWNGFLPCGLVYAYLALAASKAQVFPGLGVMLLFGLGTIPTLVLTGLLGSMASVRVRTLVFRAAAVCLLITGAWTLSRGVQTFCRTSADPTPACPFCDPVEMPQGETTAS